MAVLKCKMCGGDIELSADKTYGMCDSCGSTMTFPKIDDEQRANMFNRGNHFRRTGEFDKALAVYERIVQEDENDAEAHWCCALCRFGIEYVEDPNTFEYYPTCHRASFDSFLEDVDYLAAVEHSDGVTKRQYQKDAAKIAEVQRGILATSQNEEPFDVFICYKESEDDGTRTWDSIFAQDIYYQLTEQGWRVFFSRITLEDKAGTEYEPYIFAALNSAKVMVLVTTSAEHANAVWVKNEWSRFLSLMRKDRSKLLLPCYRDMDPYDLPEALSILQSYDMSKIGFIQDLIRGVNKVLDVAQPKATIKETVVVQQQGNLNIAPLLKRVFMFLEDSDWQNADEYCEKILDIDPENAEAYLGKLMAELRVQTREQLKNQDKPFDNRNNYRKALRFGDNKLKTNLTDYIKYISDRNETERLTGIYDRAVKSMNDAKTEEAFIEASKIFREITGFKDSDHLADECIKLADSCRESYLFGIYNKGLNTMCSATTEEAFQSAAALFESISGYRDTALLVDQCYKKAENARQAKERERHKKALAVIRAIKTCFFSDALSSAHERLQSLQQRKEHLVILLGEYDGISAELIRLQELILSVEMECKNLLSEKAGLGIFAKKEKNRIDSEIDRLREKQDGAEKSIGDLNKKLQGFDTKESLEAVILSIEASVANLEREISEMNTQAEYQYNIDEAWNVYSSDKVLQKEVDAKFPKAAMMFAAAGKPCTFFFGRYKQKGNAVDEQIEWKVLAREEDKVLVISRYALDCQSYNLSSANVTWETCSLRRWLNNDFLKRAFNLNEQSKIQNSIITADKNPKYSTSPEKSTNDKVFLLSIPEVNEYFNSDSARQCQATPYAKARGASYINPNNSNCCWWLRSPGYDSYSAAYVYLDGSVNRSGSSVRSGSRAVRPALWINLES